MAIYKYSPTAPTGHKPDRDPGQLMVDIQDVSLESFELCAPSNRGRNTRVNKRLKSRPRKGTKLALATAKADRMTNSIVDKCDRAGKQRSERRRARAQRMAS